MYEFPNEGEHITINCFSTLPSKWFVQYINEKNLTPLNESTNILTIKNVSLKNVGRYYCYGGIKNKRTNRYFISSTLLKVNSK